MSTLKVLSQKLGLAYGSKKHRASVNKHPSELSDSPKKLDLNSKFKLKKSYGSAGYNQVTPWLVKNKIPSNAVGLVFGKSQSFKTFYLIDICCRLATGTDYLGNSSKQGIVYFIAAEGSSGISKRVRAWELANKRKVGKNLVVIPHAVFPASQDHRTKLIDDIRRESVSQHKKPVLVVFDTLSQCGNGMRENDSGEVSKYINHCKFICQSLGCTVINVHHTKKNSDEFRGSSSIEGDLDFIISTKRQKNSDDYKSLVKLEKLKEGEIKYEWELSLKPLEIDVSDEEGEPVTSLFVDSIVTIESKKERSQSAQPQFKSDAEWLLKELEKSEAGSLSLKEAKELLRINIGSNSGIDMKISRAKAYLIEKNLVHNQVDGRESRIVLIDHQKESLA